MKTPLILISLLFTTAVHAVLSPAPGVPIPDAFMRTKRHPSMAANWVDYFVPLPGGAASVDLWNGSNGWVSIGVTGDVVVSGGNFNLNSTLQTTISGKADTSALSTVAFSGQYSDLIGSPVNVSAFTNDAGYITSSALLPYATSSALTTGLAGKFNNPVGTTAQYLRGDGSVAVFPSIPAAQVNADWNAVSGVAQILNKPVLFNGAYSSLTGIPSTFAPSAHTHPWTDITATPTTLTGYGIVDAYPLSGNPSGFITSAALSPYLTSATAAATYSPLGHTHTFASLTSKPTTLSGYGITDAYPLTGNPSNFLTAEVDGSVTNEIELPTQTGQSGKVLTTNGTSPAWTTAAAGTVTSVTAGTGLSGGTITTTGTISLPNTGTAGTYSGVTTDAQGRVTAGTTRSFSTPTFASSTTAAQLSTTRDARVTYDYDGTLNLTLLAGASVTATLRYADNLAMTTNPVVVSSQTMSSAGIIGLNQANTLKLSGDIPAGKFRQVTFSVTGTGGTAPTALKAGQEVLQ